MISTYDQQEDMADIFAQVYYVDEQIFGVILEIFRKEKVQDSLGYLSNNGNLSHFLEYIFEVQNKRWKLYFVPNYFKNISNILRQIKYHDFNKIQYTPEENKQSIQDLIKSIKDDRQIIVFLQFLVHLTSIDNSLIQCGSNALNLLVQMRVDLRNQNFENIKIQNTSLVGANFASCNLSGSDTLQLQIRNMKIQELNKLDDHKSYVYSVCFSPDGNTLASDSLDKSIRLWDAKTGQQKSKFDGHKGSVQSVCFSPDGTMLASGSRDQSICLWDVKTGQQKSKLYGHAHSVYSVCFSPDGTTLASGSDDNSIRLWNIMTKQQIVKLDGHINGVQSVQFSPDGATLASGSADYSIRLWDVKPRKETSFSDEFYQDNLAQYTPSLKQKYSFSNDGNSNITILLIQKSPLLQAQGALIFKGQFVNYQGIDFLELFKSKGCYIFESQPDFTLNAIII